MTGLDLKSFFLRGSERHNKWESKGTPPMPPPPKNKASLTIPSFLAGYFFGGVDFSRGAIRFSWLYLSVSMFKKFLGLTDLSGYYASSLHTRRPRGNPNLMKTKVVKETPGFEVTWLSRLSGVSFLCLEISCGTPKPFKVSHQIHGTNGICIYLPIYFTY